MTALAAVGGVALVIAALTLGPDATATGDRTAVPAGATTAVGSGGALASTAPAVETGEPANTTSYDTASLPQIDVWTLNPALPVDDDPFGAVTGELAQPLSAAPIFADPTGQPIGYLPREAAYGGTIVPVVVHDTHWVKVLLAGRQGLPPEGSAAQAVGWLRVADVELTRAESFVEVHLEARTIDIVTAVGRERVASDFAW